MPASSKSETTEIRIGGEAAIPNYVEEGDCGGSDGASKAVNSSWLGVDAPAAGSIPRVVAISVVPMLARGHCIPLPTCNRPAGILLQRYAVNTKSHAEDSI
jgi:hypothetical protein